MLESASWKESAYVVSATAAASVKRATERAPLRVNISILFYACVRHPASQPVSNRCSSCSPGLLKCAFQFMQITVCRACRCTAVNHTRDKLLQETFSKPQYTERKFVYRLYSTVALVLPISTLTVRVPLVTGYSTMWAFRPICFQFGR